MLGQIGAPVTQRERGTQRLTLLRREGGNVDQGLDVGVSRTGIGDHTATVGMPDQHDRAVNSGDERADVLTVADHTAQRIGRGVTGEAEGLKPRDHIAPTGRIGERPVDQNNGRLVGRHREEPLLHDSLDARTARQSGRSGFVDGEWTTAGSAGTPSATGRRPRTPRTHRPASCEEDAARSPRRPYEDVRSWDVSRLSRYRWRDHHPTPNSTDYWT